MMREFIFGLTVPLNVTLKHDWLRRKRRLCVIYGMVWSVSKEFFFWTKIKLRKGDTKIRHLQVSKKSSSAITARLIRQSCLITLWPFPKEEAYLNSPILTWDQIQYIHGTLPVSSQLLRVKSFRLREDERKGRRHSQGVFSCVLDTGSGFWSTRDRFWCALRQMKQEGSGTSRTFCRFPTGPTAAWSWWRGSRWHHHMIQHAGNRAHR